MDDLSGMKLDISSGEGNQLYDNRKEHTIMQINDIYGPQELSHDYKKGAYYMYLKIFGDCLGKVFSCGPKYCSATVIEIPQGMIGMKKEAGVYIEKLRPGIHTVNPFLHKVEMVDLRAQSLQLPHQDVLTKDNVTFDIDALINYRIRCPELAIFKISAHKSYVSNIAASALRSVISENSFTNILAHRESINKSIMDYMEVRLEAWGLEVDLVETQSIHLGEELHLSMAIVAESQTRASGKVIDALGHLESSKIYANAAKEFDLNPVSMDLQKWDVMNNISHHQCQTVIIPHDMFSRFRSLLVNYDGPIMPSSKNPFED